MLLTRLARLATWPCLVLLAVLSLLPAAHLVRTGASGAIEHFTAYLITAGVAATGYAAWPGRIFVALGLAVYAGLLEAAQHWVPGRQAALADFAVSALGALVGAALAGRAATPRP